MQAIFKIQKQVIRVMSKVDFRTLCKPLFKRLGIMPLAYIYIYELVIFVYKNINIFADYALE